MYGGKCKNCGNSWIYRFTVVRPNASKTMRERAKLEKKKKNSGERREGEMDENSPNENGYCL